MINAPTWHSVESSVFHQHGGCLTGRRIKADDRLQGSGDKPLCEACATLGAADAAAGDRGAIGSAAADIFAHKPAKRLRVPVPRHRRRRDPWLWEPPVAAEPQPAEAAPDAAPPAKQDR